jgi:DNA-binding NtrC family response regulator
MMIKRFWLAEDDPDDVDLFIEALGEIDKSITCIATQNGQQLISKLNNDTSNPPELIFMDVNMPEMNGWECLQILKSTAHLKDIPVIMYSTSSAAKNAEMTTRFGAFCFYEKPSNFLVLKEFLEILVSSALDKEKIKRLIHAKSKNQKVFFG